MAELLDGLRPADIGLPDALPPLRDVEFIDVIEVRAAHGWGGRLWLFRRETASFGVPAIAAQEREPQ